MRTLKVVFPNARGNELAGSLDLPSASAPRAYAIFAHCFTCNRNYKFIRYIARTLAREGVAVLRLDFTGLGESTGRFDETNFSTTVDDLLAAADFLAAQYQSPRLLIGHSLGGTAVLAAAPRLRGIDAVVTVNAPAQPGHVLEQLDVETEVARAGHASVNIGGSNWNITAQLVDDLRQARAAPERLEAALLVLHATRDATAGMEHAERIFAAASQPKSLVALPQADHLLSREADALYAARLILAWSSAYLGADAT
ncbi:MAG: alpha/beta fold hydrolase [Gammaproteobacteria bacterium]|jgi:putative redox protein|nr:alpha/beta fold hydrolase [Gammaproteobacteria bacterium]